MFIPYTEISDKSRLWIYQSNRKINSTERHEINNHLIDFCINWETHGKSVLGSFQIYDWFICLFVDEDSHVISGCSIDKSVTFIKSIGKKYQIDFFNRNNIIFIEGEVTKILPLSEFKFIMKPDFIIHNNMIQNKEDFQYKWKVHVKNSW